MRAMLQDKHFVSGFEGAEFSGLYGFNEPSSTIVFVFTGHVACGVHDAVSVESNISERACTESAQSINVKIALSGFTRKPRSEVVAQSELVNFSVESSELDFVELRER